MILNRLEYKYLVPNEELNDIRSEIRPFIRIDEYALNRDPIEYTIRSIYFDTPAMSCYDEKIDGIKIRNKFRIRGYNELKENDIIFLEIKRKYNNFISKNRAPLYNHNLQDLFITKNVGKYIICPENNEQNQDDARRFLYHYYAQKLSPTVLVVYEREAFFGRFNERVRITFDKNLRSADYAVTNKLFSEHPLKPVFTRHFILELKFRGGMPQWARHIIGKFKLPRLAISKYTLCIDSHRKLNNHRKKISPISIKYCFALNCKGQDKKCSIICKT
ncbi:MAG TPA: hypothetical protein DEO84_02920 [candidate division Zixibacteria bacterium]|nr:hypothetical protein [candidate division Zixibacteria bacterium]HBZ00252.1 hypothetical protein [candidate division Zixibacteria bacterium]